MPYTLFIPLLALALLQASVTIADTLTLPDGGVYNGRLPTVCCTAKAVSTGPVARHTQAVLNMA